METLGMLLFWHLLTLHRRYLLKGMVDMEFGW